MINQISFAEYIVVIVIFTCAVAKCQFQRWCDPYATFCLFSNGVQTTVSNVEEAQEVCEGSKENSWPLEIYDDHVMNIVKNFTSEHFSNGNYSFILNANFSGLEWRWIKNKSTFTNQASCIKPTLVFDASSKHIQCSNGTTHNLICMTNCYATWEVRSETQSGGAQVNSAPTLEECKKTCETDRTIECVAVDWATYEVADNARCWFHNNKTGNNSLRSQYKNSTTQYIIDRTNKSDDVCLANLKTFTKPVGHSGSAKTSDINRNDILIGVLVPICVILIIFIILIAIYCRKKCRFSKEYDNDRSEVTPRVEYSLEKQPKPSLATLNYSEIAVKKLTIKPPKKKKVPTATLR